MTTKIFCGYRMEIFGSGFTKGKQEFRRTDFGSRLLAAESQGGSEGEGCV
jgi:hypothetical protein